MSTGGLGETLSAAVRGVGFVSGDQLEVWSILALELFVGAPLHYLAPVQDDDLVAIPDGAETGPARSIAPGVVRRDESPLRRTEGPRRPPGPGPRSLRALPSNPV